MPDKKKQLNKRSKVASSEPLVDQRDQIKKQSNDLADNEDNHSELGQLSNRHENNLIKDFWESSEKESNEEAHIELYDNRKDLIFLRKFSLRNILYYKINNYHFYINKVKCF